jgi:FKBP-type peptidyl-prolyl cis-trans isomerase
MKKTFSVILFVVLVVAIIGAAMWYNNKSDEAIQQAQVAAGVVAEQAQQQLMQSLRITDVVVGTGTAAAAGDAVTVNYIGTLDNGTTFDSSYSRNQPFTFTLGNGDVIKGWDLGVAGMKVGGKRELVIPPALGYGGQANGPIPANSTLHFTIRLLSVSAPTSSGQ